MFGVSFTFEESEALNMLQRVGLNGFPWAEPWMCIPVSKCATTRLCPSDIYTYISVYIYIDMENHEEPSEMVEDEEFTTKNVDS